MLHVIVATHGPLAEALMVSAKMVFGQLTRTTTVVLREDGGIEQFRQAFKTELMRVSNDVDGVLVLCDLQSGTPYNIACCYAFDEQFPIPVAVVTGVNFPMLLISADFIDDIDVYQAANHIVSQSLESMVVAKRLSKKQLSEKQQPEDDF